MSKLQDIRKLSKSGATEQLVTLCNQLGNAAKDLQAGDTVQFLLKQKIETGKFLRHQSAQRSGISEDTGREIRWTWRVCYVEFKGAEIKVWPDSIEKI